MTEPILPGAVLGVLGGGQLGRMFAMAARRMGYRVSVFAPEDDTPAGQIAYEEHRAPYDDLDAVERFARSVSVVTFEFENVPASTTEAAARHAPVRPAGAVLETTQNRLREKNALRSLGLPVADFTPILSADDAEAAARAFAGRGIMKSAAWGYDGKGQVPVEAAGEVPGAWAQLGSQETVLEARVAFEREISVVGARGVDGSIELFDPFENAHTNHILDVTTIPARISPSTGRDAHEIARRVLEGLDVVGTLCVEMFHLADGGLVVNELAPRPHNSGHVTIDAHETSQFEQQVRAVCGLPLGSARACVGGAAMANLLGDLWGSGEPNWAGALAEPGVRLHLYGKEQARPGRKMGHLVATSDTREAAEERVLAARSALTAEVRPPVAKS